MQAQTVRGKGFKTQGYVPSIKHLFINLWHKCIWILYAKYIYVGGGDRLYFLCNSHEDAE